MRRRNGSAEPGSVKAAPPSDSVRNLGNGASRAHPAGARRKLPLSPANPRNAGVGEPCSREEIPAYPRSARKRQDRPVTPEVAGSSPVAPAKMPAKLHLLFLCCLSRRRIRPDYTDFFAARPETRENGPKPLAGLSISSRFRPHSDRPRKRRATTRNGRRSRLHQPSPPNATRRRRRSPAGGALRHMPNWDMSVCVWATTLRRASF
jgi:hypothetical protein